MLSGVVSPILSCPVCPVCPVCPSPFHPIPFCLKDKAAGHHPVIWFHEPLLAVTFRETDAVGVNVQGQLSIPHALPCLPALQLALPT